MVNEEMCITLQRNSSDFSQGGYYWHLYTESGTGRQLI